MKISAQAGVAD